MTTTGNNNQPNPFAAKLAMLKRLSNQALLDRANRAPDFGWDDEGAEIDRRMKAGILKCQMQGNKIVIID